MENLHKVGAIGIPGLDWECRIVDDNLNEVPSGRTGELMVRGPCVMKGYYRNPEATRNSIMDGWLLTGDMARFDEDGFIWLVDRKKDLIKTGGESIFPVEIENFLMENENIQDTAVIGIPDERLGEIVAAVIKPKSGKELAEEDVMDFCMGLPRYKRPRKILFDDVPRNPTGKIEKPKLRKKYGGIFEDL
jgi:acyl-CoA synthetase (AMP-forming)/AMP-acid ligase II